jgi:triphosphoribosyl-dephospho-CoA synthase
MPPEPDQPPLGPGACAALACIWEATAPKPGNVYRGADFEDTSYVDFLTSAAAIAPAIDRAGERGVGATVLAGVQATRAVIGPKNTNLGMLLLMAPLAVVPAGEPLASGVAAVLRRLTPDDARDVYAAIRLVQPGGLGRVEEGDVNADVPLALGLADAMQRAAERDLVARQYGNDFAHVFAAADRIAAHADERPLADAIVRGFLELLRDEPDSLIARKCGLATARQASGAAASVLEAAASGDDVYQAVLADFDFWLRSDGHRLNPGTSADIVAAALFVLLRDRRLNWPVRFYSLTEALGHRL